RGPRCFAEFAAISAPGGRSAGAAVVACDKTSMVRMGRMPWRRPLSALVGSAWLALAGYAAPPPPLRGDAPEPAAALRPAESRGEVPEAARIADYVIDARLDAERHRITGTARITWRNRTRIPVRTLPFHLYMNAFRSEDTAWM